MSDSVKGNEIERAAYIAAHRILAADISAAEFACPGARRSRAVDTIADIIKEVLEQHTEISNGELNWHELTVVFQRRVAVRCRKGLLLEFPHRISS